MLRTKRLFALILALAMFASVIPFGALASDKTVSGFMVHPLNGQYIVGTNCRIEHDFTSDETIKTYNRYYAPEFAVTILFDDGTGVYYEDSFVAEMEHGGIFESKSDQSYDNQWGIGTHKFTVGFMGFETDMEIEIIESPFQSISAEATESSYYENTNGAMHKESEGSYWCYDIPEYSLTLYKADGTSRQFTNRWNLYSEFGAEVTEKSNQSFANQWGVGEHAVQIEVMGLSCEFFIEIVEMPIESITAIPANSTVYQNTNGYFRTAWVNDAEVKYWCYSVDDYILVLNYKDGATENFYSRDLYELSNKYGTNVFVESNQSYESRWDIGVHSVSVSFAGMKCEYNVEVVESPIIGIEVTPAVSEIGELTNGHYTQMWDGNTFVDMWLYDMPDIYVTLLLKDDKQKTYTNTEELEQEYSAQLSISSGQSFINTWGVGKHEITVSFAGFDAVCEIEIVASPIQSIEVVPSKSEYYAYTNGGYSSYWGDEDEIKFWEYFIPQLSIKLNMTDGTSKSYDSVREFEKEYKTQVEVVSGQSYENPWGIGKHTVTATMLGKSADFEIEIVELPFESIQVIPSVTEYYEYTHGSYSSYWTDEGEKEYWTYSVPKLSIKLNMTDGTSEVYDDTWELEYKYKGNVEISTDQTSENPWGIGKHTVTVTVFGETIDFEIEIVESPIQSIDILPSVTEYYEYTHGSYSSYWTDEGEKQYWEYAIPQFSIKLNKSGGENEIYDNTWELEDDYGINVSYISDQSGGNPWGIGKHTVTVNLMGKTVDFEIEIVAFPIKSFEVIPSVTEYYEYTHGNYSSYWTEDGEVYFWEYTIPQFSIKLYMNDNTSKVYDDKAELEDEYRIDVGTVSDQSSENPWGIGKHTVTVNMMGQSADFEIEIVETPFQSISIIPQISEVVEYTNGYWQHEEFSSEEWWKYSISLASVTVVMKDGTSQTYDNNEIHQLARLYDARFTEMPDQSYDNQWGVGKHTVTYSFAGVKASFDISVIEVPFDSITVTPKTNWYYQYTNGHGMYDSFENEFYWYYDDPEYSLTLNFKDGTSKTYENARDVADDYDSYPRISCDQQETWGIGKHSAFVEFLGVTGTFEIEIIESPVESYTVNLKNSFYEMTNGYLFMHDETDWIYTMPDYTITLNYKDGTNRTFDRIELEKEYGVYLNYTSNQNADNFWDVGRHSFETSLMNLKQTVFVDILESDVSSIKLISLGKDTYYDIESIDYCNGLKLEIFYKDGTSVIAELGTVTFTNFENYINVSLFGEHIEVLKTELVDGKNGVKTIELCVFYLGASDTKSFDLKTIETDYVSAEIISSPLINSMMKAVIKVAKKDGTSELHNILDFVYLMGDENYAYGEMLTDHGCFVFESEYGEMTYAGVPLTEKEIQERQVDDIVYNYVCQAIVYRYAFAGQNLWFDGELTAQNIDVFLNSILKRDDGKATVSGDEIRKQLADYTLLTDIDLTLSEYYDSDKDIYTLAKPTEVYNKINYTVTTDDQGNKVFRFTLDVSSVGVLYIEVIANGLKIVSVKPSRNTQVDKNGITADVPANDNGMVPSMQVSAISDEEVIEEVKEALKDVIDEESDLLVIDISLENNIQPNGEVLVRIPLPEGMTGDKCVIYRLESDGTLTDMQAVYEDGYMVFKTSHFSLYAVAEGTAAKESLVLKGNSSLSIDIEKGYVLGGLTETKVSAYKAMFEGNVVIKNKKGEVVSDDALVGTGYIVSAGDESCVIIIKGDVSGDGKINTVDYSMCKRNVLETYTMTESEILASDINKNGKVDTTDYAMIKRHVLQTFVIK